jgi:hypothetical protein
LRGIGLALTREWQRQRNWEGRFGRVEIVSEEDVSFHPVDSSFFIFPRLLDQFMNIGYYFMKAEEGGRMANLQIKGIDENLYAQIKKLASAENRSVSQQILYLAKEYLTKRKTSSAARTSTQVLLDLSGSWDDARAPEEIIREIKHARRNSKKLRKGI